MLDSLGLGQPRTAHALPPLPGRHLVNTRFQQSYLERVLGGDQATWQAVQLSQSPPSQLPGEILFALTSANQENSRFNPIPFHVRAIGVDRFARLVQQTRPCRYRIFGIPHYGHTENFAAFTIKEIANQSERSLQLTPQNCLVICSTPEVIRLYRALGFSVAPAELAEPEPRPATPIDLVREMGTRGAAWRDGPRLIAQLAPSHFALFDDFSEIPRRIARLYQDPLTNPEGSLTDTRKYSTYARGMNEIVRLKYLDIKAAIRPGRIADEGCADGALLAAISADFPDSDLFGIDLSAEFGGRFQERQRAGEFGGAYVHFFHRNLLEPVFETESIDTTICNSTLHELWSYAEQAQTVRQYLAEKCRQLRPAGRLLIRDVVGPADAERLVFLQCEDGDGLSASAAEIAQRKDRSQPWLQALSTHSRFLVFAHDFLPKRRKNGIAAFAFRPAQRGAQRGFLLSLRTAAEFLSKKDYVDNWLSEMNEEFCFWDFGQWKTELIRAGLRVLEDPNDPLAGSRAYVSPWIVQHRWQGKVRLYASEDPSSPALPWPPTNMVLVAEKPVTP